MGHTNNGTKLCPQRTWDAGGVKNVNKHNSPPAKFPFSGQEKGGGCGFDRELLSPVLSKLCRQVSLGVKFKQAPRSDGLKLTWGVGYSRYRKEWRVRERSSRKMTEELGIAEPSCPTFEVMLFFD